MTSSSISPTVKDHAIEGLKVAADFTKKTKENMEAGESLSDATIHAGSDITSEHLARKINSAVTQAVFGELTAPAQKVAKAVDALIPEYNPTDIQRVQNLLTSDSLEVFRHSHRLSPIEARKVAVGTIALQQTIKSLAHTCKDPLDSVSKALPYLRNLFIQLEQTLPSSQLGGLIQRTVVIADEVLQRRSPVEVFSSALQNIAKIILTPSSNSSSAMSNLSHSQELPSIRFDIDDMNPVLPSLPVVSKDKRDRSVENDTRRSSNKRSVPTDELQAVEIEPSHSSEGTKEKVQALVIDMDEFLKNTDFRQAPDSLLLKSAPPSIPTMWDHLRNNTRFSTTITNEGLFLNAHYSLNRAVSFGISLQFNKTSREEAILERSRQEEQRSLILDILKKHPTFSVRTPRSELDGYDHDNPDLEEVSLPNGSVVYVWTHASMLAHKLTLELAAYDKSLTPYLDPNKKITTHWHWKTKKSRKEGHDKIREYVSHVLQQCQQSQQTKDRDRPHVEEQENLRHSTSEKKKDTEKKSELVLTKISSSKPVRSMQIVKASSPKSKSSTELAHAHVAVMTTLFRTNAMALSTDLSDARVALTVFNNSIDDRASLRGAKQSLQAIDFFAESSARSQIEGYRRIDALRKQQSKNQITAAISRPIAARAQSGLGVQLQQQSRIFRGSSRF